MTPSENVDLFADAVRRLDRAFQYAQIDEEALEKLKHPKAILQVSIPVRMDDGSFRIFTDYRVGDKDVRGPTQGGTPSPPVRSPNCDIAISVFRHPSRMTAPWPVASPSARCSSASSAPRSSSDSLTSVRQRSYHLAASSQAVWASASSAAIFE